MRLPLLLAPLLAAPWLLAKPPLSLEADQLKIDNGTVAVGIDRNKGAAITHLSWSGYPQNVVNFADPGRLIQQSYYAGVPLDRRAEGQHEAWSPWTWNPIQGGGVGAWAEVTESRIEAGTALHSETIPKLWDMKNEAAAAVMRQRTAFEPGLQNVIVVRNEFVATREENDRWGAGRPRHQELPAFYFTRNFDQFESYLGEGKWRGESQEPGPPWGRTSPPLNIMACFNAAGEGIAMFSPCATEPWNFGPVGTSDRADPTAGDCVHVAPIATVQLGPRTTVRYRYWMVVGSRDRLESSLDRLLEQYGSETLEVTDP